MRVHAWGLDDSVKAVWFFVGGGYAVRYVVRPQPHYIEFHGPIDRDRAESLVLSWTSEAEDAGLLMGWAFYTAEINEVVFVAALDAATKRDDIDLFDHVFEALFKGETVKINEPRNS